MTMADTTVQPNRTWMGVLTALAMTLILGGAAWWAFRTPSAGDEIDVGAVPRPGQARTFIRANGKDTWIVLSFPAFVSINGTGDKQQFVVGVPPRLVSDDAQQQLVHMAEKVSGSKKAAEAIGAT